MTLLNTKCKTTNFLKCWILTKKPPLKRKRFGFLVKSLSFLQKKVDSAGSVKGREMSSAVCVCFLFTAILLVPKCQSVNIFQVPDAPREVVALKKVHPPQVPEVVPAKGTCLIVSFHGRARGKAGRLGTPVMYI